MASKPIVVVTGATGQQGGGVVDALLDDGKWTVRAITRSPDSEKAKALSQRGVEVVKGDQCDVSSLLEGFKGAYGVFAVTDWTVGTASEIQFGKNMIDAAQKAGVKHFVWSGLEDVRKVQGVSEKLEEVEPGRLVPHFESKGEVSLENYARTTAITDGITENDVLNITQEHLKASGLPYTILITSGFYNNWINTFPFIPQGDGSFACFNNAGAEQGVGSHDVADVGHVTALVLGKPDTYLGKELPVVGEYLKFDDAVAVVSDATGKKLTYVAIPDEQAANLGFPGAKDIANMWKYFRVGTWWNDHRPLDGCPYKGKSFKEWVQEHKSELAARFQ